MSRYNDVLSEFVKQTTLKRIRIKTDPQTKNHLSFGHGYEGFILEEDDMGNVVVMVPDLEDNILKLGPDDYEDYETGGGLFDAYKDHIIHFLQKDKSSDELKVEIDKIGMINNMSQLEIYLKQQGLDDKDLLDTFRTFFTEYE